MLLPRASWLQHTPATWPGGTTTVYNGLGLVTQTTGPNGVVQTVARYSIADYQTSYVAVQGATDAEDRMLRWKRVIDGGLQQILLTFNRSGSTWTQTAQLTQNYDVLGNLTSIDHPGITLNTVMTYDKGGRKTAMTDDPDLGDWTYLYDRQGRLEAQRDAKCSVTCLYYGALERIQYKYIKAGTLTSCNAGAPPALATDVTTYTFGISGSEWGQIKTIERVGTATNKAWSEHSYTYNSAGLLANDTHIVQSAANANAVIQDNLDYGYDAWFRPTTVTYPDSEIVTTQYNGMGLPALLSSNTQGVLVDGDATSAIGQSGLVAATARYDVAGRLTKMRMNGTTDYWRTIAYDPFTQSGPDGGMLASIQVGIAADPDSVLGMTYTWDRSGNLLTLNDGTAWTNTYDHQSRITNGIGTAYAYAPNGTFTSWQGLGVTTDAIHTHGIDSVDSDNRYDYDANDNVTQRTVTGLTQTLTWTRYNELASITIVSGDGTQEYLYDADGIRVRQDVMTAVDALDYANYEFFPQYERKVEDGVTTNTKYYFFGGQRVAQKVGSGALTYLHADHLGSVLATTGVANSKRFYPYGATRTGTIPTDYGWTAQHNDGTGLIYMHARYYDPYTGQFVSPDTIVPDAGNVYAYNRYMYGYGNPLKYSDPSGHCVFGLDTLVCVVVAFVVGGGTAGLGGNALAQRIEQNDPNKSFWENNENFDMNWTEGGIAAVAGAVGAGAAPLSGPAGFIAVNAAAGASQKVATDVIVDDRSLGDAILDPNTLIAAAISGSFAAIGGGAASKTVTNATGEITYATGEYAAAMGGREFAEVTGNMLTAQQFGQAASARALTATATSNMSWTDWLWSLWPWGEDNESD